MAMNRRAVFLDKDGTLIEDVPYNVERDRVRLTAFASEALRLLHASGYSLFVVSNQAGVARGYFGLEALRGIEVRIADLLGREAPIDGWYYCPHLEDGAVPRYAVSCECRKPAPGLLLQAAREHGLALDQSWAIGDILNDIEAGHAAGCRAILLDVGNEHEWRGGPGRWPDGRAVDLLEAARLVIASDVLATRGAQTDGGSGD